MLFCSALLAAAGREGVPAPALPLPRPVPILTNAELQAAAADVPVARLDLALPAEESATEKTLSRRFFNRPEERRYRGITTADWKRKWQLFSDALVKKAEDCGFDAKSLDRCLRGLNQGRNKQTMLWPVKDEPPFDDGTQQKENAAFEREAEAKYQQALRERELNPEKWYDENLAIIPVGAYLARYADGECWIIICLWEIVSEDDPRSLGHIKVWAMDAKTASVVAYVTCD